MPLYSKFFGMSEFSEIPSAVNPYIPNLLDRLEFQQQLLTTQEKLLSKQTSLYNEKDSKLKKQSEQLANVDQSIHTKRRVIVYDEKDDKHNRTMVTVLKWTVMLLSFTVATLVYRKSRS